MLEDENNRPRESAGEDHLPLDFASVEPLEPSPDEKKTETIGQNTSNDASRSPAENQAAAAQSNNHTDIPAPRIISDDGFRVISADSDEEPPPAPTPVIKPGKTGSEKKQPSSISVREMLATSGIGETLQAARVAADYSIAQTSGVTKIKKDFIEAIERDEFSALPSPVWVRAYLKKLALLYGVDEESANLIRARFDESQAGEPNNFDDILEKIEHDKTINPEEARRSKKIFAIMTTLFAVAAAVLLGFGIWIFYHLDGNDESHSSSAGETMTAGYRFPAEELEVFIIRRRPAPAELEIPE